MRDRGYAMKTRLYFLAKSGVGIGTPSAPLELDEGPFLDADAALIARAVLEGARKKYEVVFIEVEVELPEDTYYD
jgi:hypothetical protein